MNLNGSFSGIIVALDHIEPMKRGFSWVYPRLNPYLFLSISYHELICRTVLRLSKFNG